MSAPAVLRCCAVCGRSIAHKRSHATTCDPECRVHKHRGYGYTPGACEGCQRPLKRGRELKHYCDSDCLERAEGRLAERSPVPTTATDDGPTYAQECECDGLAYLDPEKEKVCSACGKFKSAPTRNRVNGYDRDRAEKLRLMGAKPDDGSNSAGHRSPGLTHWRVPTYGLRTRSISPKAKS